ncbi:winged helix-turn-helix domain-containing protein [Lacibacterium aquatile]|uniref:Winged helix-turn-helix domain-containing protein n=1 Tax=Lacibacterium aquatile TaxID=1168082 RepID=A0ABW5E014_9PROT
MTAPSRSISPALARAIWLRAQKLDTAEPFGSGPEAVRLATEHLGYVQIDTINVIERCHHHILFTRIPSYRREDLQQAQSVDKSVFEYWTHALAYVPSSDYRYFIAAMDGYTARPNSEFVGASEQDYKALLKRIRTEGPLSIRDIEDEVLVEKTHLWASRKPSKRALNFGFYSGDLTVSSRLGMLKSYELAARHFGWSRRPKAASEEQYAQYLLRRALRAQGIISLESATYGDARSKPLVKGLIEAAVKRKKLVPVQIKGAEASPLWVEPALLDSAPVDPSVVHILSPFDPLIIQRKRLKLFFDYDHRFEAYVPPAKRVMGYFALPVLVGDRIVAAIDLKMDRQAGKLLVQKWNWIAPETPALQATIDEALHRFEAFQKPTVLAD